MLTGWVTADGNDVVNEENGINTSYTFFCDETGARVESSWVYTTEPATADDDADADEYWYYLKSSGKVATGKQTNIKGQAFILGNQSDNLGQMLTGWVGGDYDSSDKSYAYKEIDEENSTTKLSEVDVAYYCLYDEDKADGHVQENKWVKTWRPEDAYDEDEDDDKFWYWLEKDGKAYIPAWKDDNAGDFVGIAYKYALGDGTLEVKNDGEAFSIAKKKINSKDYFFNKDGEMVNNFIHVVEAYKDSKDPAKAKNKIDLGMYYFGGSNDGSMKTGSQTIKDDNDDSFKFYFGTKDSATEKKGVGITGNKNNKLYYEGHLVAAEDYKYQPVKVLGATFIVNQNGSIQHSNVEYKEDGDVLINAKNETGAEVKFVQNGLTKYAITTDTLKNVEFYVEEINPKTVMSIDSSKDITASVPTVMNAIEE